MKEGRAQQMPRRGEKEKEKESTEAPEKKKKVSETGREREKVLYSEENEKRIDEIHKKISNFIKDQEKVEVSQKKKNIEKDMVKERYVEAKKKASGKEGVSEKAADKADKTDKSVKLDKTVKSSPVLNVCAEKDKNVQISDVETKEKHTWEEYGLKKEILYGLKKKGFIYPSPVQAEAIPHSLKGENIIARAKNGTGKTGAFVIPLLNKIDIKKKEIQALILVPTRELVLQTVKVMREIGGGLKIKMIPLYGGLSTKDDIIRLRGGAQIIVGTPGRVFDFSQQKVICLSMCKYMVCDEADKLLNREFKEIVCQITEMISEDARIELYSATFPCNIYDYIHIYMRDTVKINLMEELTLRRIEHYYAYVKPTDKLHCLKTLIGKLEIKQCFIFCNAIMTVERLAKRMTEIGFVTYFIHSQMRQEERNIVFHNFSTDKKCKLLVCTDLVTRGIDVPNVNVVINFDLPLSVESYLHRVGRSGRFGRRGIAVNMITPTDIELVEQIEARLCIKLVPFTQKKHAHM